MNNALPSTTLRVLDELKSTVMLGRFCNESAMQIDQVNLDIVFDIEPLTCEPFALQNENYEHGFLPNNLIYRGIDRDNIKSNKFPTTTYQLSSADLNDKIGQINGYYQDMLVLYRPLIKSNKVVKNYYRNLEVIDIVPIQNQKVSNHYYTVPKVDMEQFTFEEKLVSLEYFDLEVYSYSIYKELKFVICGDFLYQGEFVGHPNGELDKTWKSKDGVVKKYSLSTQSRLGLLHSKKIPFIYFLGEDVFYNMQINENPNVLTLEGIMSEKEKEQASAEIEIKALKSFFTNVKKSKLCYSDRDLLNFHICMKSAPLVIVAGKSGTGKTRIALEYANLLDASEKNNNFLFFPISPGLHDPSDITGYYNAHNNEYVAADGGLVDFLIHAQNNQERMHLVIFDEMNLAQIEHYFSQFLSILEQDEHRRILHLYNSYRTPTNGFHYPPSIKINTNVLFVGTVNIDETTRTLSDRLLDRCFVVNLNQQSFQDYFKEQTRFIEEEHPGSFFISSAELYKQMRNSCDIHEMDKNLLELLDKVNRLLSQADNQKGVSFRTVKNIGNYLANANQLNSLGRTRVDFVDLAFKQTICKKMEGDEVTFAKLLGNDQEKGSLVGLLKEYEHLSDFRETRDELRLKRDNLMKYGYTSRR